MAELDKLRVDTVGSLLRSPELQDAFVQAANGRMEDAELRRIQDEHVAHVVREQERIGLPIISDGETRRTLFMESFGEIAGFEAWSQGWKKALAAVGEKDGDEGGDPVVAARIPVDGPLKLVQSKPLDEYKAAQALTDRPVKITVIGPDRILQAYDEEASRSVYPDLDAFLTDVVAVEREIVAGLRDAGCRYVQMDAPGYTAYVDKHSLADMESRGVDPMEQMRLTMKAENGVVEGFDDVTFGIHLCRGNRASHWHREGGYDAIAEELFNGLKHQRLLLEYDSERAGTFEPLRFVPKDKVVVLGLVTTKTGEIETVDQLVRGVEEASKYLPVEQLAISPQCGFASVMEGNRLTEDDQWRKLEVLVEAAQKVWGGVQ